MTDREFQTWFEFYKLAPFDDRARYFRPAALVAHSMSGADLGELIGFLAGDSPAQPISDDGQGWTAADLATFKAMGMKPPRKV